MQLEALQLQLRPRPHAQALDLGFALARAHALRLWSVWLALCLPLALLCFGLTQLFSLQAWWCGVLLWWLRPLLERSLVYVLARQVFGEQVSTRQALRAFPGQLRGGWIRLLTWWRPFMPGRALYHAVWQLEGARGSAVGRRLRHLSQEGAGAAAFWFGVSCSYFEVVLQLGLLAMVGLFFSEEGDSVLELMVMIATDPDMFWLAVLTQVSYLAGLLLIGPLYTAGCFTLYLNRRAALEAWDLEIGLRQLRPAPEYGKEAAGEPPGAGLAPPAAGTGPLASLAVALCLLLGSQWPQSVHAAGQPAAPAASRPGYCGKERWVDHRLQLPARHHTAEQLQLRQRLQQLYLGDKLRVQDCDYGWVYRPPKTESKKSRDLSYPSWLPSPETIGFLFKMLFIALLLISIALLLYRYRDRLPLSLRSRRRAAPLQEIRGLDIRPESLPDDVVAEVLRLQQEGQRRPAMALLFRATVSRLVHEYRVPLTRGATEGDCLRLARPRLAAEPWQVLAEVSDMWLQVAWAGRQVSEERLQQCCVLWRKYYAQGQAGSVACD